jgi:hypothetical protein
MKHCPPACASVGILFRRVVDEAQYHAFGNGCWLVPHYPMVMLLEYAYTCKSSTVGLSSDIIPGFVGITPACGSIPIQSAALAEALPACASSFSRIKLSASNRQGIGYICHPRHWRVRWRHFDRVLCCSIRSCHGRWEQHLRRQVVG